MITTFDVINLFFKELQPVSSEVGLSGGIYKGHRPDASSKEDIVINALPITGNYVQTCVVNVNSHVPDIKGKIGDKNQGLPDYSRMETIGKSVFQKLHNLYGENFGIYVSDQVVYKDTDASHFFNLRFRFRKHNASRPPVNTDNILIDISGAPLIDLSGVSLADL